MAGTAFSWATVVGDYRRFFAAGGGWFTFGGTAVPNPLATPCVYGALCFAGACWWALRLARADADRVRRQQPRLVWLLAAGTLFAVGNLSYTWYRYRNPAPSGAAAATGAGGFGCPAAVVEHALLWRTPCFFGALLFASALGLAVQARRTAA